MEVARTQLPFTIEHDADVGALRRHVTRVSHEAGFDETRTAEAALVATELATNVLRHAGHGGALVVGTAAGVPPRVSMLVWDRGPGMVDVAASSADGVSTTGTRGVGLGAVKRLASSWDAFTHPGRGTTIFAELLQKKQNGVFGFRALRGTGGGVCVPCPGETVSGDRWEVQDDGSAATVLVCDGLGHGPGAADAAAAVSHSFLTDPTAPLAEILVRADRAARATRGAAATVARANFGAGTLTWAGVGNVTPSLVGQSVRQLVVQHGTLGQRTPRIREEHCILTRGDAVVVATDGLRTRFEISPDEQLFAHAPELVAAVLWRDFGRGRDDATAVVLKAAQ